MSKKNQKIHTVKFPFNNEIMVVNMISRLVIPLILMFGFYIQFHGEVSPGGGFQSGIIFAIAFIMRDLLLIIQVDQKNNYTVPNRIISDNTARKFAASGVLIYSCTGILCMLFGYNLFDYTPLAPDNATASLIGLFLIEIGVSSTVFGAMTLIYNSLVNNTIKRSERLYD